MGLAQAGEFQVRAVGIPLGQGRLEHLGHRAAGKAEAAAHGIDQVRVGQCQEGCRAPVNVAKQAAQHLVRRLQEGVAVLVADNQHIEVLSKVNYPGAGLPGVFGAVFGAQDNAPGAGQGSFLEIALKQHAGSDNPVGVNFQAQLPVPGRPGLGKGRRVVSKDEVGFAQQVQVGNSSGAWGIAEGQRVRTPSESKTMASNRSINAPRVVCGTNWVLPRPNLPLPGENDDLLRYGPGRIPKGRV